MIADIVAEDREGRPVLLVEVKAKPAGDEAIRQLLAHLAAAPDTVTFGMLVDPETIRVYGRGNSSPVSEFGAIEVLSHYSPGYGPELIRNKHPRLLETHVHTLAEVWLRDLVHQWKPGEVPRLDELERIGLLPLLRGGSIDSEARLIGHSLR